MSILPRVRLLSASVLVTLVTGCSSPSTQAVGQANQAAGQINQATGQTSTLTIDASKSSAGRILEPQMLGVNSRWLDSGDTIMRYGEMVRDRSFRNHDKPGYRWLNSPNKETGGKVKYYSQGGHSTPLSGTGYPGYVVLSQNKQGYTCVSQPLLGKTIAGEKYELHVSAKLEKGKPALSVFIADGGFMPIEEVDNLSWVEGDWKDYSFTLEPTQNQDPGLLRVCIVTPGSVAVDEVRLWSQGKTPQMNPLAKARMDDLGFKSLRWPTGSDADYFDWKTSIGPLQGRGENLSAFGDPQTPTWGLHEFLDFCESEGILPLMTVNIRQSPENAADLVEYVLGSPATPMGKLRAKNGRNKPWNLVHFELGNEPIGVYRDTYSEADTSKGYVKLSKAVGKAMRAKADQVDRKIYLKAVLETTFADADWIAAVPMLAKWNPEVLNRKSGLLAGVDHIKGNFYSGFTWDRSEKDLFHEVMAGGTTLVRSVEHLEQKFGKLPPYWVTEYGVMVQKSNPTKILLEHAKDYQAGLAVADILISSINAGFGGAYAFNLAEAGTWGMLANHSDYRLRPSGLAFSMLAKLAGQQLLPVQLEGVNEITIDGGKGNNPRGTRYPSLAAVASHGNNEVQLIVLNRSYDAAANLTVNLQGKGASGAAIHQLGPYKPTASNDQKANTVTIKQSSRKLGSNHVLEIPPRTLMRVVYK